MVKSAVQLGIFAKPPRAFEVKTRLIPDIGAEQATEVYRTCLGHAVDIALASELAHCCYLTEPSDDPVFQGLPQRTQKGESLGDRMLNALTEMLSDHQAAIVIGTDCLDMTVQHLQQAADLLLEFDMVLQPVLDGGYSLIGCRNIQPSVFEGVRWSSDEVMSKTLHNAEMAGYRTAQLETVRDIDTLGDLQHYSRFQHLLPAQLVDKP